MYEDDFAQSSEEYLSNSGQFDEQGNKLFSNTESNGRFHTDWLNMMYPRLKIAKDFLTEDGFIFISIDDNEYVNVKKVCDEIFGEKNYVSTYVKQSKVGGGSDSKFVVKEHEYCFVYSKNIDAAAEMFVSHTDDYLGRYKEKDKKGRYFWDTFARPGLKNPIKYDIVAPDGTIMNYGWIHSQDRFLKEVKDGTVRIIPKNNGGWSVQFKQYLNLDGKKPRSMTMDFGGSIEGKNDIKELFDNEKIFSYPKSVKFISNLIKTIVDTNCIIMDFFSGSATTAHAVMKINSEDEGARKFILVQLPEICGIDSEAYKEGYRNICDLGIERIARAGLKIREKSGLLGNHLDLGFRVLSLDSSNMNEVFYNPKSYNQNLLEDLVGNVKEDRTPLDLLFQVMLELGIELSAKIEEKVISGKQCFVVNNNDIVACFDSGITDEVIKELAKVHSIYAVFKDSAFASDSSNINCEQIFKSISPSTTIKVI